MSEDFQLEVNGVPVTGFYISEGIQGDCFFGLNLQEGSEAAEWLGTATPRCNLPYGHEGPHTFRVPGRVEEITCEIAMEG